MTLNTEQQAGVAWVDIGKDAPLAANIIERIETKISGIGGKN
jgi:hypothetical protein